MKTKSDFETRQATGSYQANPDKIGTSEQMKPLKIVVLSALLMAITSFTASATIWRVNNTLGVDADFTSVQVAHDSASAGDTILVEGSTIAYGNLAITKLLYIYGTGYFLTENDSTQAYPINAKLGNVTFNAGSGGSRMQGFQIGDGAANAVTINTDNIIFERNYINLNDFAWMIVVGNNRTNIIIRHNYLVNLMNWFGSGFGISIGTNVTGTVIYDNYIHVPSAVTASGAIFSNNTSSSLIIRQNVLMGRLVFYNTVFENNIYRSGNAVTSDITNIVRNNLCNGTQFPAINGNQQSVNMTTVFLLTGSTDGQWRLKIGSPAIGAGFSEEDCGMYGNLPGVPVYILSGMPEIPAIFAATVPVVGTNSTGLDVNVKVKSHK